MLYIFILGTGFPPCMAVRTFPLICCTLGFCERSCKNSGWRVSHFSIRRLENMTEPPGRSRVHARAGFQIGG